MAEETARIDADVHAPVPTIEQLGTHLAEVWRDYLSENGFRQPPSSGVNYPPGSAIAPVRVADQTLDALRARALGGSRYAVLSCSYGAEAVRHPYMAAALATAVNSWLRAEWLDKEPRLLASLVVTPQDTEAAVAEIERCAGDKRFVQLFLPARSWEPYGNHRYWPIWEAAERHGIALGVHFGGYTGVPATPNGTPESFFEEYSGATQLFAVHLMSLLTEGVFDRFPALRVVLLESGVGWLPTWMWKLDTDWKATRREIPWVKRPPSEYIRERVRLTVQPFDVPDSATAVTQLMEQLGSDEMLMFSSDYPHDHGSSTDTLLGALSADQRRRLLHDNAWDTYGLARRLRA